MVKSASTRMVKGGERISLKRIDQNGRLAFVFFSSCLGRGTVASATKGHITSMYSVSRWHIIIRIITIRITIIVMMIMIIIIMIMIIK